MIAKKKKIKIKKLQFGTYPYTAIRSLAMRSLLLKREDYMRMQKMGINEIIRFLSEGQYRAEISALSGHFRGRELVNLALNMSLSRSVRKLLRISIQDEVKGMIRIYANKWVVKNLKLVARVKMNKLNRKHIRYGVIPIEPATFSYCKNLYEKNAEEMKKMLEKIDFIDAEKFMSFYEKGDLMDLENYLDMQYYGRLHEAAKNIGNRAIKEFISNFIELTNIRNVVKLKAAGIDKKSIDEFIVGEKSKLVAKLLESENIKEILEQSRYRSLAADIDKDPANLENNIEKFLLQYSSRLLHSKLTSMPAIFGYLVAKEMEMRNIRLLVNSIDSRIEEEFISSNLIIPE